MWDMRSSSGHATTPPLLPRLMCSDRRRRQAGVGVWARQILQLTAPVLRCRVHVRAWEVGSKRVAVQATLASRCAHPLIITACHTQPQVRAL